MSLLTQMHSTRFLVYFTLFRNYLTDAISYLGYFTENFEVKENKTKLRNIHPRFFHLLFSELRLEFELGFALALGMGLVLE